MDFIKKMLEKEIVRYIIAGGMTTVVNLAIFYGLRLFTGASRSAANLTAIIAAIIFAFFANKFFVFISKEKLRASVLLKEFVSFIGARLVAMFVEVEGLNILCDSFRVDEFAAKIAVQFIVIVINYVLSKIFVFKKEHGSFVDFMKRNAFVFVAFFIPALFLLYIWIYEEVGPFGGHSLTMVDSLHQYLPFFSDYYDKLTNEGSLFYTWDIGLGSNMLSIIAYYMASPLSFIVVFFDRSNLYVAMSLLIGIKICLSSATFAYYMREKCGGNKPIILGFALLYALNNYVIGYSWNVMWMDCIMALPIIMLGFERMMENDDHRLYTVALFYGLMCNYYIAFMICIFLVLQFLLTNHGSIRRFVADGIRFAVSSIVAACMAAFLLIPAYLDLNTTASATREWPESSSYGSIWDMVSQLFYGTSPIKSQTFDGGLNAYCGCICAILAVVFLFHTRIKLSEKIKNVAILAIIFISFNNTLLNYIWHGFHDQYGIPNRFAFLFIFLVLAMSCQVVTMLEQKDLMAVMAAVAVTFGCLIVAYGKCDLEREVLVGTEIFMACYALLLVAYTATKGKIKYVIGIVLLLVCVGETVKNAVAGYESNGTVDISYYFDEEESMTEAVDFLNAESINYRIEVMNNAIVDEPTYYNLKSVSLFGSTVSNDLVNMMHDLGFYTGANEFLYDGANTLSNSLLGVKYLLQHSDDYNYFDMDYVTTVGTVSIYQNPYALSLGYMVSDDLLEYQVGAGNMFETMNQFVELATGVSDVYERLYPAITTYSDNCDMEQTDDEGEWFSYTRTDSSACSFELTFTVEEDASDIYIFANCSGVTKIRVYVDYVEQNYERLQNQSYHVGHLNAGQTVTVEYVFGSEQADTGQARFIAVNMNRDAFLEAYDILSANQLDITTMEDGYVKGTVTAVEDGLLFTSIPYDAGWTVYVDGDKWDIDAVGDAFIGVWLDEGEHEIVFKYFPPGLGVGLILTILGWAVFAIAPKRVEIITKKQQVS